MRTKVLFNTSKNNLQYFLNKLSFKMRKILISHYTNNLHTIQPTTWKNNTGEIESRNRINKYN